MKKNKRSFLNLIVVVLITVSSSFFITAQPVIDGTFDGTATWGASIHSADGNVGWVGAAVNLGDIYLTNDGTYLYLGITYSGVADWQSWGIVLNTVDGQGGSNEVWGYPITYGHSELPDVVIKGHFGQGGSSYAEMRMWDGSVFSRLNNDGIDAGLSVSDFSSDETGMIEVRIKLSTIGNPVTGEIQAYISGNVSSDHAVFDAIPDDEVATSWNDATTLDTYTANGPFGGSQIIEVIPSIPKDTGNVKIILYTSNTDLAGASKVYLHSGVSTISGSPLNFNYVKGNWGQDDGVGAMTLTGPDTFEIILSGLRSYYGVPETEDIFGLNFLFRSFDGGLKEDDSGNNYHIGIDPANYITLDDPSNDPFLAEVNTPFPVNATAMGGTPDWELTEIDPVSDAFISQINLQNNAASYSHSITLTSNVERKFKLKADFGNGLMKFKTFNAFGFSGVVDSLRPAGMQAGINYHSNDSTKATLILHAPTYTRFLKGTGTQSGVSTTIAKDVVHVVGDFNNWEISDAYKMNRDRDGWDINTQMDADSDGDRGDYWWITIDNLIPGQEYIYQYLIDGNLQVGDPYAEKVSDPDDGQISSLIYPGLISYSSQAVDRASILQTGQNEYTWEALSFTKPSDNNLNIYELHFRDFTEEGTYAAAIERLDYIQSLGINAIHVMPVSEFEGNSSWGYNPNFYFAADKAYGPKEELKRFIDECHKRKIQVFNDLVLNHSFYSNVMARMYWNEALNRPADDSPFFNPLHKMVANPAGWWGADWNHESEHVQKMLDRILDYWLQEYKFDGFRFDFTKGFGQSAQNSNDEWASNKNDDRIDLLDRMVTGMKARNSQAVTIFEHLAASAEDKILADDGVLMWSGVGHHNDMKGFVLGYDADQTNIYNSGVYNAPGRDFNFANWMSYPESHDEQRLGYELLQFGKGISTESDPVVKVEKMIDRLKLAWAFNLFLPGPRMIWQFGELGYDIDIDFNGRTGEKPVRWDYYQNPNRKELYRLTAKILRLRNENSLYASGPDYGNIGLGSGNITTPRFMKLSDGNGKHVIVIGNLDPDAGHSITPSYPTMGTWYKYNGNPSVDGEIFTVNNINDTYLLNSSEAFVLTNFAISSCLEVDKTMDSAATPNTLRSAINCASELDSLELMFPVYSDTITLSSSLDFAKSLSIITDSTTQVVLDGRGLNTPSLTIAVGKTVHLKGVKILCNAGNGQACIENNGILILEDMHIDSNGNLNIGTTNGGIGVTRVKGRLVVE